MIFDKGFIASIYFIFIFSELSKIIYIFFDLYSIFSVYFFNYPVYLLLSIIFVISFFFGFAIFLLYKKHFVYVF